MKISRFVTCALSVLTFNASLAVEDQSNGSGSAASAEALPKTLAVFHAHSPVHGDEPWITDGTEAGTRMLGDLNPGMQSSAIRDLGWLKDDVVLVGPSGRQGWAVLRMNPQTGKLDGVTLAGGRLVKFLPDSVIVSAGGHLLKSDGTEAGTKVLVQGLNGDLNSHEAVYTDRLFCSTNGSLYEVDPATGGQTEIFRQFQAKRLYIAGENIFCGGTILTKTGLWVTSKGGSPKFLFNGEQDLMNDRVAVMGGALYFRGIQILPEVAANSIGVKAFQAAPKVAGRELYRSDGTEKGTVLVKDIRSQPEDTTGSLPDHLVTVGNQVFFTADDGVNGRELWVTDGTEAGTRMVKDIGPGSSGSWIEKLVPFGDKVLFYQGTSHYQGREGETIHGLWVSDGTEDGTFRVMPIGVHNVTMTNVGNCVLFQGQTKSGKGLWRTDGTEAGTRLVKELIFHSAPVAAPSALKTSH